jgi:hypothetical protein
MSHRSHNNQTFIEQSNIQQFQATGASDPRFNMNKTHMGSGMNYTNHSGTHMSTNN